MIMDNNGGSVEVKPGSMAPIVTCSVKVQSSKSTELVTKELSDRLLRYVECSIL